MAQLHTHVTPKRLNREAIEHLANCPCPTCEYYRVCNQGGSPPTTPATLWEAYSPYSPQMLLWVQHALQQATMSPSAPLFSDPEAELKNHMGHLAELSCSAEGRALLQSALRLVSPPTMDAVVEELTSPSSDFNSVALDHHGNHVIRSLFEYVSESVRSRIVSNISCMEPAVVLNLATSSQYSRKLLETVLSWRQLDLTAIDDVLVDNCLFLAVKQHGCLTLKAFITRCSSKHFLDIIRVVSRCADTLTCDQYGNYFMQALLERIDESQVQSFYNECFRGRLCHMSTNKFGSNVMERLARIAVGAVRKAVVEEMVLHNFTISTLINDPFANFVIQALLDSAITTNEHRRMCDKIRPFVHRSPYAQKFESKMRARRCTGGSQRAPREPSPVDAVATPT